MTAMRKRAIDQLEPELASLVRRLDAKYRQRGYPLERAQYLLLTALEPGAKSTGEIADQLGLDHSTVVRQVDAVQALGFASRAPNPADRRSVQVGLTPQGASTVADMRVLRRARLAKILTDWPQADLHQFAKLLARFNAALVNADREGD